MREQRSGNTVLVGVANLEHVQQLVRTAGDLAQYDSGGVCLVTVTVKTSASPFSVLSDETIVREFADDSAELLERTTTPDDVDVDRDIFVARSAAQGLLAAIEETNASALIVGWHGTSRRNDAVFGSTVDKLVKRAPCDLYVERVGREADGVDSILLPVAGGPHVETAARAAAAIAGRNDARVLVFSVDTQDGGAADASVAEGSTAVLENAGDAVPVDTKVVEHDDVTAAIVDEASAHDIIIFGTTRQRAIRRKLVGSVPRRVVDRTDQTVILARNSDTVGGLRHRLAELFKR